MKIAYFGTPDFSARFLENLLKDKLVEVAFVVTQKDKKVGRKQVVTPSAVKQTALKNNIEVKDFVTPGDLKEVDLALLFAYGKIISQDLLDAPRHGFWNVHPSLLPKYRGASPVAFPLINGDNETGVTLMKMDVQTDHGPIIAQQRVAIKPDENRQQLTERLAQVGYKLFRNVILGSKATPESGQARLTVKAREQDHSQATYTKILSKDDGLVNFSELHKDAQHSFNLFRGLYPWPGLWTKVNINGEEKRLKITDLSLTQNGELVINKVQLEGKNEVPFSQFQKAYKIS